MHPFYSIVLPVYNGEKFLKETLLSIYAQTFTDYELLILDDGSTDNSINIVKEVFANDEKIQIFKCGHVGLINILNYGLKIAKGIWIARIDSDDIWDKNKLLKQYEYLGKNVNNKLAVLGTYGYRISENGKIVGTLDVGPKNIENYYKKVNNNKPIYLIHSSVVFNKEIISSLGGYRTDYQAAEDLDLWTRVSDCYLIQAIPERLVKYRVHMSSWSGKTIFTNIINAERVTYNITQRRDNKPELNFIEYKRLINSLTLSKRLIAFSRHNSQYFYRRGGASIAIGRPQGIFWLLLSFFLNPLFFIKRFYEQVIRLLF